MSSALIGNNITGRQFTKIKVDRWFSLEFFSGKYVIKQYKYFMFVCTMVLYECMKSLRNYVNN